MTTKCDYISLAVAVVEINSLEHHGLNRCLDAGIEGYQRYVGMGVMSYDLHVIGRFFTGLKPRC